MTGVGETGQDRQSRRFYWVDALRGCAALVIVVFHYHHFYLADASGRPDLPPIETFPYASVLTPAYGAFAANAVELFWVISGFVFMHVYLPRRVTGWTFFVARFARLYPLHFATLIFVATLQAISLRAAGHWQIYGNNDALHFMLQLFMSSDWSTVSYGLSFNGPIWSVSLEVIVYLGFFVSLFAIRRAPLAASFVLCTSAWVWSSLGSAGLLWIGLGVFLCAGYFFLGALLYTLRPDVSRIRFVLILVASLGGGAVGYRFGFEHMVIAAVAVGALTLAVGLDHVLPPPRSGRNVLGDISYSLYLVHVPLQMVVLLGADVFFEGTRDFAQSSATLPLYVIVSVAVAVLVHSRFEKPVGWVIRHRLTG